MKNPKIIEMDINQVRFYASEGYTEGEIADLLKINYQALKQYKNHAKNKEVRNHEYYKWFYKALKEGQAEYKKRFEIDST